MSDKNESKKSVLDRLSRDLVDDNCSESEDRKESIDDTGVENEERGGILSPAMTQKKVRDYTQYKFE